eukprot:4033757-Prymnesium_polylepis.1
MCAARDSRAQSPSSGRPSGRVPAEGVVRGAVDLPLGIEPKRTQRGRTQRPVLRRAVLGSIADAPLPGGAGRAVEKGGDGIGCHRHAAVRLQPEGRGAVRVVLLWLGGRVVRGLLESVVGGVDDEQAERDGEERGGGEDGVARLERRDDAEAVGLRAGRQDGVREGGVGLEEGVDGVAPVASPKEATDQRGGLEGERARA